MELLVSHSFVHKRSRPDSTENTDSSRKRQSSCEHNKGWTSNPLSYLHFCEEWVGVLAVEDGMQENR